MSFLADYLHRNSGNEVPRNYHIWSALTVLSSIVSRKVCINMDQFKIYPNLYVCLVGDQANRKTIAKDIAYDLLRKIAPELPVSGESMSKEAITKFMAANEQLRTFVDAEGNIVE